MTKRLLLMLHATFDRTDTDGGLDAYGDQLAQSTARQLTAPEENGWLAPDMILHGGSKRTQETAWHVVTAFNAASRAAPVFGERRWLREDASVSVKDLHHLAQGVPVVLAVTNAANISTLFRALTGGNLRRPLAPAEVVVLENADAKVWSQVNEAKRLRIIRPRVQKITLLLGPGPTASGG